MEGYGEKLIKLRGTRSRREVAEACGISTSALGMYELEERVPKDENKKALANYYGVTVQEIFFD